MKHIRMDGVVGVVSFIASYFFTGSLGESIMRSGYITLYMNVVIIGALIAVIGATSIRQFQQDSARTIYTIGFILSQPDVHWNIIYLTLALGGPLLMAVSSSSAGVNMPLFLVGLGVFLFVQVVRPPKLALSNIQR